MSCGKSLRESQLIATAAGSVQEELIGIAIDSNDMP